MGKIKKILTENIGLKVLAIILAAVMWFLVTNIDDPTITVNFYNVPVTIINTSAITSQGKIYEILDGTDTLSLVRVTAPRSVADSFTKDNIIATADMNDLTSLNTLPITVDTNKYSNQVEDIDKSINAVKLSIEDSKTRTLRLSAQTVGTVEDGYIVSQIVTEQNVLRISGPESAVDSVASSSVTVDVTGFTSDIDTDADINLYDADGNVIEDGNITMNISAVRVTVTILQTKRVPVRAQISGTPAAGYLLTGVVELNPDTVLLAGKGANLGNLDELVLSGEDLDVTDMTENLETSMNLRSLLPTGVSLGDGDFGGQVSVMAEIVEASQRELELPVSQINVTGIPEGMKATIQTQDLDEDGAGDGLVTISVSGLPDNVSSLNVGDITGTIDIAELIERLGVEKPDDGTYTVTVNLTLPAGIYQAESVSVLVYLEEGETGSNE